MKAAHFLLVAALVGCGERTPTGVAPQAFLFGPPQPGASSGLVRCTPLSPDSVSQTIGPLGGTLQVGPHRLWIPPGALSATITIMGVAPSDTVNRVRFGPQGLTFQRPALLVMSYANCGALANLVPKQIAYTDEAQAILELLPSVDNLLTQKVNGRLEHFSDYAIAW